jgi:hypothetical protein
MTNDDHASERCAGCGRDVAGSGAFCRFYPEGSRVSLCEPACATRFLRDPERSAAEPTGDLVAELVEEWHWTWGHGLRPACARVIAGNAFTRDAEPGRSEEPGTASQRRVTIEASLGGGNAIRAPGAAGIC